ncbi:MAG: hypothetical protein JRG92_19130 [Deltaproteobacteria bacterium]|nr:hypothetical protein [Deltaproteobacteria bacterium]MBW2385751.1 hypothetical protein [Deltaproteobacteria bacterium]
MASIEVLDPTSRTRGGEIPLAPRLSDLHEKALGFFDNGKWNARLLLDNIAQIVREQHVSDVETTLCEYDNLDHYAENAEDTAYIEQLSRYDGVVIALGD